RASAPPAGTRARVRSAPTTAASRSAPAVAAPPPGPVRRARGRRVRGVRAFSSPVNGLATVKHVEPVDLRDVVATAAVDHVTVAVTRLDPVVTRARGDVVAAGPADDHVVAAEAADEVEVRRAPKE